MASDASNEKELFRHLGLLSNEVMQIQKTLRTLDSREAQLRAVLDDLTLEKETLVKQAKRLEAMVKEAANSALDDAEREREQEEIFTNEKAALQSCLEELEKTLGTKEANVKDLQEEFSSRIEELHAQIREKDSLLRSRNIMVVDLKTAASSLNQLIGGLSSNGDSAGEALVEVPEYPARESTAAMTESEEHTSLEIETLKKEIREKELALAAKSVEFDLTKERMADRIKELEMALNAKSEKKSPRLVSLIADMGGRRFL